MTISEFLPKLREDAPAVVMPEEEQDSKRRALIVDQFEEIFNTHDEAWEKHDGFFLQLAQAMADDPYLWVIFVMREDYIASLDPYAYLVPGDSEDGTTCRDWSGMLPWRQSKSRSKSAPLCLGSCRKAG